MNNYNYLEYNIKLGLLNVRSLLASPGFDMFVNVLHLDNFDIFAVTETWLNNNHPTEIVDIPEFNFFRHDRGSRGGGVGLYIKSKFQAEVLEVAFDTSPYLEHLWVKVSFKRQEFIFGVIYRPPAESVTDCIAALDNLLPVIVSQFDNVIILGDVNVDLLNTSNKLTSCFEAYGLSEIVKQPTRVTSTSSTLIDQIFTNKLNIFSECFVLDAEPISDHKLISCQMKVLPFRTKQKFITYRDFPCFMKSYFSQISVLLI